MGPGSYDPEFKLTKPRVKASKFRAEVNKKKEDETIVPDDNNIKNENNQAATIQMNSPLE